MYACLCYSSLFKCIIICRFFKQSGLYLLPVCSNLTLSTALKEDIPSSPNTSTKIGILGSSTYSIINSELGCLSLVDCKLEYLNVTHIEWMHMWKLLFATKGKDNTFKNIFILIELCCGTPFSKVESFF